ncbi:MAG: IS3 family transposase [Halobacteriovoraceae bacterium]|jgi:putative transposase|nr:IS3 family transposase [Halobacteriovoraceae bacterium]
MLTNKFGVSERRSCKVLEINRSTIRYELTLHKNDVEIIKRMTALVERYRRYGYPRVHFLLNKEGLVVNRKRTQRIYKEQGFSLRLKRKKKKQYYPRIVKANAAKSRDVWSMDFVSDSLTNARKLRSLTVIDHYSRFCPGIYVDHSISGEVVTKELDKLIIKHGKPKRIQVDNGPEFTSKAMMEWSYNQGIELDFTRPGTPTDNAFIESFNGTFRDECLNQHWFSSLAEAKILIEKWRKEYNEERIHSSLNYLTPKEFVKIEREGVSKNCSVVNF